METGQGWRAQKDSRGKKEAVKAQRQKAGSLESRLKVWALGSGHGVCER